MELNDLLNDLQELLNVITTSRKGSIGSINNIYLCQLDSKWCNNLSAEVQRHLTPAAPDAEGCIHCDSGEGIPSAFNYCPYCSKKLPHR